MRRPARLERAGAMTPRDRMWAAIRGFGNHPFSVAEIMALAEQIAATVLPYLDGLEKAGYIKPPQGFRPRPFHKPRRECRQFYLERDVGVEAPRVDKHGKPVTQGIGREQIWRAARILKNFDAHALAAAASTITHPVPVSEVKFYTKFLTRAGYLVVRRAGSRASPGCGPLATQYSFVQSRYTGPRAPLVTKQKTVIDANSGEEFK